MPAANDRPIEIGSGRGSFLDPLSGSRAVTLPIRTAELSAALDDLADPGPALVAAAAILTADIGQAFGVTELGQLSRDGELRPAQWNPQGWQQSLIHWAEDHGIAVAGSATTSTLG